MSAKDLEVFARIPASVLRPWLTKERDEAVRYLTNGTDMVVIHRAQGKVQLIEQMQKLLDESQTR